MSDVRFVKRESRLMAWCVLWAGLFWMTSQSTLQIITTHPSTANNIKIDVGNMSTKRRMENRKGIGDVKPVHKSIDHCHNHRKYEVYEVMCGEIQDKLYTTITTIAAASAATADTTNYNTTTSTATITILLYAVLPLQYYYM